MPSKFYFSKARGKTPSICKKVPPPDWWDVPDYPIPDFRDQYCWLNVQWTRHDSVHPWNYASRQPLAFFPFIQWTTTISTDPDFTFDATFLFSHASAAYQLSMHIVHQGHAFHTAQSGILRYDRGQPFFLPRFNLVTDNDALYKATAALTI